MKDCSVKVGHILKLGLSTRLFVLQGPEQDMEAESELTVTQLKEKRQAELAAREIEELEYQRQEEERAKQAENQGIDWGMGKFRYKPQLSDVFSEMNISLFILKNTTTNNNNNIYLLQLGCHPVAVVILHVYKI